MWHVVHFVGPDFWPALFFSLWHLVHNLFITYFFFSLPSAFSSAMLPDFCGNTEWHILQSPSRSWCWRWGNGTLPFLPALISMLAEPLFWSAIVKATEKPAIRAATSRDTTRSFIFINARNYPRSHPTPIGLSGRLNPNHLNRVKPNWGDLQIGCNQGAIILEIIFLL